MSGGAAAIRDPVFGALVAERGHLAGRVALGEHEVALAIPPGDDARAHAHALVAAIAAALPLLRAELGRRFAGLYDLTWREAGPKLSAEQLGDRLAPTAIRVHAAGDVPAAVVAFSASELFGGRALEALLDGSARIADARLV